MMKKILSITLVLLLCLSMLAACGEDNSGDNNSTGNNDGTTTTTTGSNDTVVTAADAKAWLVATYQKGEATEPMVLKDDMEVVTVFKGMNIVWSVSVTEGDTNAVQVTAVDGENKAIIAVADSITAAVNFTAIATVTDAQGTTDKAEFLFTIPGPVADPAADSTLTVKEASELGASKAHNEYTTGKYYIVATVVNVTSTQYGNMQVKDDEGNTLTIYGSYGPDGNDKFTTLDPQPKAGDKVKLYGIIGQYNDTPQMKNAWIKEVNGKKPGKAATTTRPSSTVKEPAADSNVSIADAIAIGLSKESNVYTDNKYYVSGTVTEVYNEQYGNMKIKDDKGNILTIYGSYSADGKNKFSELKTKPKAGDTVTIYGKIGQYQDVAQIKNGWITKLNGKAPEVDSSLTTTAPKQDVSVVDAPAVGKAYKFGMIQKNVSTETVYFLKGGMNGYYMDSTNDVKQAIDVYLEEAEGGYYLYTMVSGKKTYINMVVSGTHVNGAYETTAKTVYVYDSASKTLKADVDGRDYWFGTRNDREYTTIGPCAVDYAGFYCMFYA